MTGHFSTVCNARPGDLPIAAMPQERTTAMRSAKLEDARRFITENFGDPDLNPEQIAQKTNISVRGLHMCFEPTGESLGRYIRRCRLERCRAVLESPSTALRSVMEIAFDCGFSSIPTFYRAFRNAYGVAPRDIRAAAGTRNPASIKHGCPKKGAPGITGRPEQPTPRGLAQGESTS